MVVGRRGAEFVDVGHGRRRGVRHTVEEPPLVEAPVRPALAAGAVVGHHDDQGVVQLSGLLQEVEHPPEPVVVVGDVAGEHLGHPGEQLLFVGGQRVPRSNRVEQRPRLPVGTCPARLAVGVDRAEFRSLRQQAEGDLALEDAGADGFVAVIEHPLVAVGPLERDQVGGVAGLRGQVHEEGLVRIDHLGIPDELHRFVRHVVGEVVAVLGSPGWLNWMVVVDQVRKVGVGLPSEPAVEALESPAQGPPTLVGGKVALLARREVPLAHAVGVVALAGEDLGDESVFERDSGGDARESRGELGDGGHPV